MQFKKTLKIFLILILNLPSAYATDQDLFIDEVLSNRQLALVQAIDLNPFVERWSDDLLDLKRQSLQDPQAEERLHHRMNHLVDFLRCNYNEAAIELLKLYAPVQALTDVAQAYFSDDIDFNPHNQPEAPNAALKMATQIYQRLVLQTLGWADACHQEFLTVLNAEGTLQNLKFLTLPCSMRTARLHSIERILLKVSHGKTQPLNLLHSETQETIIEDLRMGLDYLSTNDKQNCAWCLSYLLGDHRTCANIYEYSKNKTLLERNIDLPPFTKWLKTAKSTSTSIKLRA